VNGHAPGDEVDGERAGVQSVAQGRRSASEHGPDPREQLVVVERPRHVVVAAAIEGANTVDRVGLGAAEHDHGHLTVPRPPWLALPKAAAQLGRGEDERGLQTLQELERFALGLGAEHVEAVVCEVALEEFPGRRLRLGEQHGCVHGGETSVNVAGRPDVL
jgi:hypothetical protein